MQLYLLFARTLVNLKLLSSAAEMKLLLPPVDVLFIPHVPPPRPSVLTGFRYSVTIWLCGASPPPPPDRQRKQIKAPRLLATSKS